MPAPPALPPLPPPRLELPTPRRNRVGGWLSLVAHLLLLLSAVELTRNANFWNDSSRSSARSGSGGGGGGPQVQLLQLAAPPPPPVPALPRVTPPIRMPTTIPAPEPTPAVPAPDTLPRAGARDSTGSGGGSGGGVGGGIGSDTGSGRGQRAGPGTAAPDSTRTSARPPEPRQLILPPFDYPRSMRGLSIDVNFFVLADGRVDHVVFVPEIPDRAYARKLEDAMRAYRFRPARSAEGQAIPGVSIVKVSF